MAPVTSRTATDVYDSLLRIQAAISFDAESAIFAFPEFDEASYVVDLGCGSGHFVRLLADAHPTKQFVGIDPDEDLIKRALTWPGQANLRFVNDAAGSQAPDLEGDVLIARLAMMYVHEPESVAAWAAERFPVAVIVDAADDLFRYRPALPLFTSRYTDAMAERVRRLGGSRDITSRTPDIWMGAGYQLVSEMDIVIPSGQNGTKAMMHQLMVLNAELVLGAPLTTDLCEELFAWSVKTDSYLQYGLRARRFVVG